MQIRMTNIYVNDPVEAFRFYTDVLGFVEVTYIPEARLAVVASADDHNGTALLLEPNEHPIASTYQKALFDAGFPAIVFSVPDLQMEYDRLMRLGVHFLRKPTRSEAGLETVFDDTCGNLIQIVQAL